MIEKSKKLRHFGAGRGAFIEHDRKKKNGWKMEYSNSIEAAIQEANLP